jgi:arylsulfatase A-like enzyme
MMEKPAAVVRQTLITLVSLGVCVSFYTGLIYALIPIVSHRYFQYGMYRLSATILREQLNTWLLVALVTVAAVIFIRSAILFLFPLIAALVNGLHTDAHDTTQAGVLTGKRAAALAGIVFFTVIVSIGWVMSDVLAVERFNRGSCVLFIVLLMWSFIRGAPKNLTCLVQWKALLVLCMLLCLNTGMLVANTRAGVQRPNIILLVIDCLRPDHLGCHGYGRQTSPAIDRLARNGLVCTTAYSNAPWTKPSVATLFTSFYPQVHGVIDVSQVMPDSALTIAEVLGNSGYKTFFINGGNPFIDDRFNFNQGFDYYHYLPYTIKNAADVTLSLLSQIGNTRHERFFAYVHYMDTHAPYAKNKYNSFFHDQRDDQFRFTGKRAQCNNIRKLTASGALTEQHRRDIVALYDGQIRYIDENIQIILSFLQREHLFENTVVIVTSDYGEEFWEHNNYEHGHTLYNEVLRVPLIISGGTIEPAAVTAGVSLIDVLPTVLDIAGIPVDSLNLQGVSLLKTVHHNDNSRVLPVFSTGTLYGSEKYCLVRDSKKMIVTSDRNERKWDLIGYTNGSKSELYNVRNDAHEQENLIATHDEDRLSLEKDLESFTHMAAAFQQGGKESNIVISGVLKERLNALGYLE